MLAYRTVPLYALRKYHPDPLNADGSVVTGGRYNIPEYLAHLAPSFPVLYLAETTAVAHAEAQVITAVQTNTGLTITPGKDQHPRLDITVSLRLRSILDLTSAATLSHLDLADPDLLGEWFELNAKGQLAFTQQLARAALDTARFEALCYPSARYPGGRNYAVFTELVPPENRQVIDPQGDLEVFTRDPK